MLKDYENQHWKTIIEDWDKLSKFREPMSVNHKIGKTSYSEGLRLFMSTALMIAEGMTKPDKGVCELINISAKYGNPFVLQEWLHSKKLNEGWSLDTEKASIQKTARDFGMLAAKRKLTERDEFRVAVLNLLQEFSAVSIDSLRLYPHIMGNALQHNSIVEGLRKLSITVAEKEKEVKPNYVDSMYKAMYGTDFK